MFFNDSTIGWDVILHAGIAVLNRFRRVQNRKAMMNVPGLMRTLVGISGFNIQAKISSRGEYPLSHYIHAEIGYDQSDQPSYQ